MTTAPATGSAVTPRKILKGKPKPLYFWSAADVNKWWRKHGGLCYQLYGDLLTEHDVGGKNMPLTHGSIFYSCFYSLYPDKEIHAARSVLFRQFYFKPLWLRCIGNLEWRLELSLENCLSLRWQKSKLHGLSYLLKQAIKILLSVAYFKWLKIRILENYCHVIRWYMLI